jgi:predicted regulator of Ras-like GTPase activity (Roadblock/LC7/MglB family)
MTDDLTALLGPEDLDAVNRLLGAFVEESGARCALLLDRAGRPLTAVGETGGLDETSFASLAAADFDAGDHLASLLGEEEFRSLYHQGIDGSMYLSEMGGGVLLAAVFDGRTTLGMVRLKTRQVVPELTQLIDRVARRPRHETALDASFADDAVSQIDRLFTG